MGDSLRGPEVTSPSNTSVLYKLLRTTHTRAPAPLNICSLYPLPLHSGVTETRRPRNARGHKLMKEKQFTVLALKIDLN